MSMAPKRRRNDKSLPWILAIEALASSNQTDTTLLTDLVKRIPGGENNGKNVRELVCLRILESLSLLEKGKFSDALPQPDSSTSDCCQDVLRQVLRKSSRANQKLTESELSNTDIEPFVQSKRSCLPKCGLEHLKDVILKGRDLVPFSVKEKSGLFNKNHSNGNATRLERSDSDAFENPPVGDLSSGKMVMSDSVITDQERLERNDSDALENPPIRDLSSGKAAESDSATADQGRPERSDSDAFENPPVGDLSSGKTVMSDSAIADQKRPERNDSGAFENPPVGDLSSGKTVMSDSATANQGGPSACNQLLVHKEYPNNNASLKRKQDAFCTQKGVEGKGSASFNERRHVDDVPGGIVQHSGREDSDLPREPQVENLRDIITTENVDYDCVSSKKLKMSSTVDEAKLLHNQLQGTCNVEKMTQGTSGEEHGLNISTGEATKDGEGYVELRTIGSSPQDVNQGTQSVDGSKENCEHSFSLTPNSVCCGEVKATTEHDHQPVTLSDDENDEILIRNNTFLNSQYSHSQDSLTTLNGTKKLCMVCNIGGQLLVCNSGSCQRVVHERCMDVAPTFDATRSFYCPFCAYSQAISEYSESKKKYSLARKALVAFINRDEYRMRNSSNISCRADPNHLKESEISDKCVEQNRLENVVSREIESSSKRIVRDKPSASCDSLSRERARAATCGGNEVALEDKRNAEKGSSSVRCQSTSELEQQVPVLGVQNGEADSSLHGGKEQHAAFEKLQEVSHQPEGVPLVEKNENQDVTSLAVQDSEVNNSKSKDLKISHGHKQHAGTEKEHDVSNQPPILPCEPAKPTHSNVAKSSGEKNKSKTCPSLRVKKRKQQYTYPSMPQLRRKKIPWSNAEEEALKEGVSRFASNHERQMPWKTILEFGGDIFVNRTAIDLKDKWRNICKGSPRRQKV